MMAKDFQELYTPLGHTFKNPRLLKQALTLGFGNHLSGYERLEFLGDRVLGMTVAHMLFFAFPKEPEGDLARRFSDLTRAETLAFVAGELKFNEYIIKGAPANAPSLTKAILSDICESVIAALYLDGGFEVADKFIRRHWGSLINKKMAPPVDSKTKLQEWAQGRGLPLPVYEELEKQGPDHNPLFLMQVTVQGFTPVSAWGASKREASQLAAAALLKSLEE